MTDSFRSFHAKVQRARRHHDELQNSMREFTEDVGAYGLDKEVLSGGALYLFRLKLHRQAPMVEWALSIGDCIHNLGSALDHIFWALVVDHHGGRESEGFYDATFLYRGAAALSRPQVRRYRARVSPPSGRTRQGSKLLLPCEECAQLPYLAPETGRCL